MRARLSTRVWAAIAIGIGAGGAAFAQTAAPANPGWSQTVTKATGGQELDPKQTEIVNKLNAYFNQLGDMKGMFVQTSPDGKTLRGKIYIKRPSYFRFEYNRPSRQLIISDGTNMAILDLDLKTDDRWGLDRTPFKMVMRKDVDLIRDAKILDVGETEDRMYISLQDKDTNTIGRLKLVFAKNPVELKEWVTTDSQNQDTKVDLTEFAPPTEPLDPKLFVPPQVALEKLQQ
jgi:outer membrane lipoprotein-sorting protein